ncbi:hypothetical protein LguiA_036048 [Lonicera macranthoides]
MPYDLCYLKSNVQFSSATEHKCKSTFLSPGTLFTVADNDLPKCFAVASEARGLTDAVENRH